MVFRHKHYINITCMVQTNDKKLVVTAGWRLEHIYILYVTVNKCKHFSKYSVSATKYVTRHNIFLESPRPLSSLGIGMVTLSSISIGRIIWLLLDTILSARFDKLLPLALCSLWIWFDLIQSSHVYLSCSFVWNRKLHIMHSCSQS